MRVLRLSGVSAVWLMLSLSLSYASDVLLSVGDGSGMVGSSENKVEIILDNSSERVKSFQLDVCDEDNYLSCAACETTERAAGFSCSTNEQENGCCRLLMVDLGGDAFIEKGAGSVVSLQYDVSGAAPAGECRELTPVEVKISDENQQPLVVTSQSGEFCFFTSSTTTTVPSVSLSPNLVYKSRWIPLPYLMVIRGEGMDFQWGTTRVDFDPPGVVFPLGPLVWDEIYIWDLIWVMPSWWAGVEEMIVTVTVATEEKVAQGDFEIRWLPFPLMIDHYKSKP